MTPFCLLILVAACRGAVAPLPVIEVDTALPGASAETMASAVTTPLERQFGQMTALDTMTSTSTLGDSQIHLGFARGTDLDAATQSVQAALNAASNLLPRTLPAPPTYAKVGARIARFLAVGDVDSPASRLSQLAGVGRVDVCGAPRGERWLAVDPVLLAGTGLTIDDVRTVIAAGNSEPLAVVVAYKNGAPIRLRDIARERAARPPACRATDATGAHVAIDVYAQPGADRADVVERIAALRQRPELQRLSDAPTLPDEHELLVAIDPRGRVALGDALAASGVAGFFVEQRDDEWLVRVAVAGDPRAAAAHLRTVAGIVGAGVPTTIVELSGADPAELAQVARLVAARFTARDALVATEGLDELSVVRAEIDRDTAARLGITLDMLDRTLLERVGIVATTVFTQLDLTRVILSVDGDGPLFVRATGGSLVPLDAVVRMVEHREPTIVLHTGQFPAVRLYTTDGEVGDVPATVHASVAPYR